LLKLCTEKLPESPVIILSGIGEIKEAVEAMKQGAADYIHKKDVGQNFEVLFASISKVLASLKLQKELRESRLGQFGFAGRSKKSFELLSLIEQIAPSDSTVLITGESGTGKELVARAIHKLSKRSEKLFVDVNCAAIPTELIESELFGHEKGSFTGAQAQRIGKFQQADGGTLFLDEVGDLSSSAQAKILRALEERIIERVGGAKPISVDVRIIAATNKNLQEEIRKGVFREDLFHRLNVIPVNVPPLRERTEEIPQIAKYYLTFFNRKLMKNASLPHEVMQALTNYHWPGNIRELMNLIERGVTLATNEIRLEHVKISSEQFQSATTHTSQEIDLNKARAADDLKRFEKALKEAGQITKASERIYGNRFGMSNRVKAITQRYPDLLQQFPTVFQYYGNKRDEK
jgi:two-component system nitrogen regulation response regulator NtrX